MLGKTRQNPAAEVEELFDPEVGQARGMLRRPWAAGKIRHARRRPAREIAPWIAHYWLISWDLRGCEPHMAESLPHPNVHLVFGNGTSLVYGVRNHKFSHRIEGQSHVFGVKFRPGGFRPFLNAPVATIANRAVPARRIFGKAIAPLEAVLLSSASDDAKIQAANEFFHERVPKHDPDLVLAGKFVDCILRNPSIKTVDDLARATAMGKRSLQRLFNEYVGASPKWVIRRYRLHEVIEQFNSARRQDWTQLALELGYFDQAHLINDFKSIVGYSPTEYRKLLSMKLQRTADAG